MKKLLPILLSVFFVGIIFITSTKLSYAAPTPTATPTVSPSDTPTPVAGKWVKDQEVTFVGKTATRANDFLQWTLENYSWISITGTQKNPIQAFWQSIMFIVYVLLGLFVLGAAFVMIVTRGQNLTIMKFIPRLIFIIVLIFFSFAIIRFLYTAVDVIQGFFLRVPDLAKAPGATKNIGPEDLLFIAFDYKNFIGFRQIGIEFDESAFISLLLVKLTAITYYVMTGLLLIRKIILWFFIVVSPIFPLLLFFRPVRNTAKIWVGEFFRWLLYAPLFALFLHGLVVMWRDRIPLNFDFTTAGKLPGTDTIYPTAINILLGGPGQALSISNSVNLRDTFALYVVALLMLWVVILLPFLLLQIFLDYLNNVSISENPVYKRIAEKNIPWLNRSLGGTPPPPPGQPPTVPGAFGMAKSLPFFNKKSMQIPTIKTESVSTTTAMRETRDVMRLANLSIPKMRDIARFETSMISNNVISHQEISRFNQTLEKIAKPSMVGLPADQKTFSSVKEKLVVQQQKGDSLASSILSASKVSAEIQGQKVVPGAKAAVTLTSVKDVKLPTVNKVQQVSIEEYEEVKKMWEENYHTMDAPKSIDGKVTDKESWIKSDGEKITETINLLSSVDQQNVDKGMEMVANILPFLLVGGFSKTEVVAYLKAKLEAGKTVLSDFAKKNEDEDTMVEAQTKKEEVHNEMTMSQEIDPEEKSPETPKKVPGEENVPPESPKQPESSGE